MLLENLTLPSVDVRLASRVLIRFIVIFCLDIASYVDRVDIILFFDFEFAGCPKVIAIELSLPQGAIYRVFFIFFLCKLRETLHGVLIF